MECYKSNEYEFGIDFHLCCQDKLKCDKKIKDQCEILTKEYDEFMKKRSAKIAIKIKG